MLCLVLGLFFVAFRILFPHERLIGLAGATILFWGLYCGLATSVEYPTDFRLAVLVVQYGALALFYFFFADFTIEIADFNKRPFHQVLRVLLVLSGPCLLLFYHGQTMLVWLNMYWLGGLVLYFNFVLLRCAVWGHLLEKREGRLLLVQALIMLVMVVHDYLLANGFMGYIRQSMPSTYWPDLLFENYHLTLFGVLPVIFVKSAIVIDYYRANRDYRQNEAVRVASALRQSEARLRETVKKQHEIQNIKLVQQERERLLMEIHDGVGSQLISGMLLAQKEGLKKQSMLDMIQGCIDDVRVIIDCISLAEHANAVDVFETLLGRLRPRLAVLGIALHYQPVVRNDESSEISDAQCLHASRIIQECIANAIKHGNCRTILVSVRQYAQHLFVAVLDDGGGIGAGEGMQPGRGLKNMRKRGRLLGGQIKFRNRVLRNAVLPNAAAGFSVMLRFRNKAAGNML